MVKTRRHRTAPPDSGESAKYGHGPHFKSCYFACHGIRVTIFLGRELWPPFRGRNGGTSNKSESLMRLELKEKDFWDTAGILLSELGKTAQVHYQREVH